MECSILPCMESPISAALLSSEARNATTIAADLLRTLWQAGTPYIHWRMPWIGYEYWDPEKAGDERFLPADEQRELIGKAVGIFAKTFSSAAAVGLRSRLSRR